MVRCWLVLLYAVNAYPHGGGLDAYGCHQNRKAANYHCHRGQFAGESFSSQQQMLQKLNQENPAVKNIQSLKSSGKETAVRTTPSGKQSTSVHAVAVITIAQAARRSMNGGVRRQVGLFLALCFLLTGCAVGTHSNRWRTVERVIDGDTLLLDNRERVRLIGVDT